MFDPSQLSGLQIWLLVVAGLRVFGAFNAFFWLQNIQDQVYSIKRKQVTELFGRLFGTWTLMSCTLCLLTAYDPSNRLVMFATFMSFVLALGHFFLELVVFKTATFRNCIPQAIVAGTSIFWLGRILF